MRRLLLLTLAAAIPTLAASAGSAAARAQSPSLTLNVTVSTPDNHPVRNLKSSDFHLTDNNIPQTIQTFSEHSSLTPSPAPQSLPVQPPGTFTDYSHLSPGAPITILLLDALNTPTKDQAFLRYQLQQYVEQASPTTHLAIFGLANHLILLQAPTSDPSILRTAVEHKLIPRTPTLVNQPSSVLPSPTDIAANLRQFQSDAGSLETELRPQLTLDALNTLAHYLATLPGRKTLLWLSASFPFSPNPTPPPSKPNPNTPTTNDAELRETLDLLARAQVAIDPIDAHPLLAQPAFDEAHPHRPISFADDLKHLPQTPADARSHIDQIALATGGQPILNATNLAATVAQAIAASANFYTLTYTPTPSTPADAYHPIHLTLTTPGPHLAYLRGYFPTAPDPSRARAYTSAAMARGGPTPEALFFKVRVLPASTALETAVAPHNDLSPDISPKGPFRRYLLDFLALPAQLTFTPLPDGNHLAKVEFLAYVYDAAGRLLDATGTTISLTATPANFTRLQHSAMQCHLELSVPDRDETFLRLAERDIPSNRIGVLEIPTADVSHLPPPPHRAPPPAGQSTPPGR